MLGNILFSEDLVRVVMDFEVSVMLDGRVWSLEEVGNSLVLLLVGGLDGVSGGGE